MDLVILVGRVVVEAVIVDVTKYCSNKLVSFDFVIL